MELFATSGGGTLFPPNLMDLQYLDSDLVLKLCPYADDLWLKTMQVLSGVKVIQPGPAKKLKFLPDTQKECLWKINIKMNDVQLTQIKTWVDRKYGVDYLERKIFGLPGLCPPLERVFYAVSHRQVLRPKLSVKRYIKKILFG